MFAKNLKTKSPAIIESTIIKSTLSTADLLLFAFDTKGNILMLEGREMVRLGLDSEDLKGTLAFQHKKIPVTKTLHRRALAGEVFNIALPICDEIYETHMSPLKDDEGAIIGSNGYSINITRQMELEQALDEERFDAMQNQKLISLARLAGGVAHEINNPLAIISNSAELLQMGGDSGHLPPSVINYLTNIITTTTERIAKIVLGLQELSGEVKDIEIKPFSVTPVRKILDTALEMIRSRYATAGIEIIDTEFPTDLQINCRKEEISRVIYILLINSLEAIKNRPHPWVKTEIVDQGSHILISITDSGDSIPDAIKKKIFEPFFTTKGPSSGGLGLPIAKGLIENHRGTILIDETCKNTKFDIRLPK